MKKSNFCKDCGTLSSHHIQIWIDELVSYLFPPLVLSRKFESLSYTILEKLFSFLKMLSLKNITILSNIQLKSACFIKEAEKHGIKFKVLCGANSCTNYFNAEINDKSIWFEGLPIAGFLNRTKDCLIDDKWWVKKRLREKGFPFAKGRAFWFWQKKQAINFGMDQIGFPLVVKPRSGSVSRHVTTNIQSLSQLKDAIDKAVVYSPRFIVEKFINTFVHRATVVDCSFVACVKEVPANIIGDGLSTIQELIDEKNNDSNRGYLDQKEFTLYKIIKDTITDKLLDKEGYHFYSVPKKDKIVWLQENPFLRLGGDLIEVTTKVHYDNMKLFKDLANSFGIKLVGIDFLCEDISVSWKDQQSAVLELNTLPCIEMHHFPFSGEPQNVAKPLVDMFFKYYL